MMSSSPMQPVIGEALSPDALASKCCEQRPGARTTAHGSPLHTERWRTAAEWRLIRSETGVEDRVCTSSWFYGRIYLIDDAVTTPHLPTSLI